MVSIIAYDTLSQAEIIIRLMNLGQYDLRETFCVMRSRLLVAEQYYLREEHQDLVFDVEDFLSYYTMEDRDLKEIISGR